MSVLNLITQTEKLLAEAKENLQEAETMTLHWTDQVEKLTSARHNLNQIFPDAATSTTVAFKKGVKVASKKADRNVTLPKTDKAFWMGLMSNEPQKTAEILSKAAAALHIKDDSEAEMTLLKQRQAAFLQNSIADKSIKSEGERLNRTYQLA